ELFLQRSNRCASLQGIDRTCDPALSVAGEYQGVGMDRHPISQEGYDKLREQIRQLEDVEMPRIAEKIAEARAEGDLSENAEYHGQREAQGLMQARINRLKEKLANSYIVDKST